YNTRSPTCNLQCWWSQTKRANHNCWCQFVRALLQSMPLVITVHCAKHHANRQMRAVQRLYTTEQISYGTSEISEFPTPAKQVNWCHYCTHNVKI
ncbi:hypothetical protein VIGAN_10128900, partial [Vigna angularis var. angularis]